MQIRKFFKSREAAKFLRIRIRVLADWKYNRKGREDTKTGKKHRRKELDLYLWSTTFIRGL